MQSGLVNINQGRIAVNEISSIVEGAGYTLLVGVGTYLTMDITKQFIDKGKGK